MTDKKPPKPRLNKQDITLWKHVTQDVKRAKGKDYLAPENDAPPAKSPKAKPLPPKEHPVKAAGPTPATALQQQNIDRRTEDRLRKGKIRPEATLDLHGMTQDQAHDALGAFIIRAWHRQNRCILVITGKGGPKLSTESETDRAPGILRRRVPGWLDAPTLNPYVLRYVQAVPKDGGAGALYVYLRKNKG